MMRIETKMVYIVKLLGNFYPILHAPVLAEHINCPD